MTDIKTPENFNSIDWENFFGTTKSYVPKNISKKNSYVSPLWTKDLKNLPPTLIITAEFDPLRDEGEAYAAKLQKANVPVVTTRYQGMIHGFFQMGGVVDKGQEAINKTAQALKTAFAQ